MNTFSDNHAAIYEEPVDERIRKFLKLENYFLKINKHKDVDDTYNTSAALNSLIRLYQTMSRAEVKRIDKRNRFSQVTIHRICKIEGADKVKLNSIMEKQSVILNTLHNLKANYLNDLHVDELFQHCVKHSDTLSSELDYWLTRDHAFRQNQINLWLELIKPIENSIYFCLDILRKSSETREECAKMECTYSNLIQKKK